MINVSFQARDHTERPRLTDRSILSPRPTLRILPQRLTQRARFARKADTQAIGLPVPWQRDIQRLRRRRGAITKGVQATGGPAAAAGADEFAEMGGAGAVAVVVAGVVEANLRGRGRVLACCVVCGWGVTGVGRMEHSEK